MITDLIHICTKQFGNECIFSPVQNIEIADDFGGEFLVRIGEEEFSSKLLEFIFYCQCGNDDIQIVEEKGSFLKVKSTLLTLSSIREQMKLPSNHFLILALID